MLYVLEGCDGAGKSTLAHSLAKVLDAEIIHCTSKTPNNYMFFRQIVNASKNKNIIADRFCYGQFVYQKDGERPLGDVQVLNSLETLMLDAGVRVILVDAPTKDIEERLNQRGETLINGLTVDEVRMRFKKVLRIDSILGDNLIYWETGGEVSV